jgi:predicted ABC-type ATPase
MSESLISCDVSTSELHRSNVEINYGPYKLSRYKLDYGYHSFYSKERQEFQDYIIKQYLENGTISKQPYIIFTAGVMGAGKGHVIKYLGEQKKLDIINYIHIDPDKIKYLFPEMKQYIQKNSKEAGSKTHLESTYISEIILWETLKLNKNLILDGSLRYPLWHESVIQNIRESYPNYLIGLIHVIANKDIILKRVEKRFQITGRYIPEDILINAFENVPNSVEKIKPLVDYFEKYNNNNIPLLITD